MQIKSCFVGNVTKLNEFMLKMQTNLFEKVISGRLWSFISYFLYWCKKVFKSLIYLLETLQSKRNHCY